jgi:hypothetical protein
LQHPLDTLQFFLIIVGSIVSGRWLPTIAGIALLGCIAWLAARRGLMRRLDVVLWIAFLLLSAGAAAVNRVGFGVAHYSRYAPYSSCLVAILLLMFAAERAWSRRASAVAFACAAAVSLSVTAMTWPQARKHSFGGHLLAKAIPADATVAADPYFGILHYDPGTARKILLEADRRGIYEPRRQIILGTRLEVVAAMPPPERHWGRVDSVTVTGNLVSVRGWTDAVATSPGRTIFVVSPESLPARVSIEATSREDIAQSLHNSELLYGGFLIDAEFASAAQAAKAAARLCVAAQSPRLPLTELDRDGVRCASLKARS